jgi:hypothetical protein
LFHQSSNQKEGSGAAVAEKPQRFEAYNEKMTAPLTTGQVFGAAP